jgi:hypothetical protein
VNQGEWFKLRCPSCDTTQEMNTGSSSELLRCLVCMMPMVPDTETQSVAEVACRSCMFKGLVNADACPLCGEPFGMVQ